MPLATIQYILFCNNYFLLAQPQQANKLEPELGTAQPQLVLVRAALCRRLRRKRRRTLFWSERVACASGATKVDHYFAYFSFLVGAECVRCLWLLAQTKVANILGIFHIFFIFLPSYLLPQK